jgi:hypothetical protein
MGVASLLHLRGAAPLAACLALAALVLVREIGTVRLPSPTKSTASMASMSMSTSTTTTATTNSAAASPFDFAAEYALALAGEEDPSSSSSSSSSAEAAAASGIDTAASGIDTAIDPTGGSSAEEEEEGKNATRGEQQQQPPQQQQQQPQNQGEEKVANEQEDPQAAAQAAAQQEPPQDEEKANDPRHEALPRREGRSGGSGSSVRYVLLANGREDRVRRPAYSTYGCRPHLPGAFPEGVVDFVAALATSWTVAVVGDSVGVQIAQLVEEAVTVVAAADNGRGEVGGEGGSSGGGSGNLTETETETETETATATARVAHQETHSANLVVAHPTRGGGTFVSYRINGMFWSDLEQVRRRRRLRRRDVRDRLWHRNRHRNLQLRPQPWNRSHVHMAMRGERGPQPEPIPSVDALVQRITFPWTPLDRITPEALDHNTRVASGIFGMRTLVYVNFYFCNNVADPEMHALFREKLQVVRDYARSYVPPPQASGANSTVQRILLLDMDRLVDLLNEDNARRIGYDPDSQPFDEWMMSHYRGPSEVPGATQHHYHAQLCGDGGDGGGGGGHLPIEDLAPSCPGNSNFVDGMHFCPQTLGGRVVAGIGCLLECADRDEREAAGGGDGGRANSPNPNEVPPQQGEIHLRACERRCNDKFMSLDPVPMSEMVWHNETS